MDGPAVHEAARLLYTLADNAAAAGDAAAAIADAAAAMDAAAAGDAAAAAAAAAADAAAAAPAAAEAPVELIKSAGPGPLTPIANFLEGTLKTLDAGLEALHVPYSYGFAIILLTCIVKAVTFPLSKQQIESSTKIQKLQPRIKALQEQYRNDPEELQLATARLYKAADVNPLAGCLPAFATLPVFIGLYRALTNAANEGLLTDGFFWLPSLAGPSSFAVKNGGGLSWLFPFVDGHPPIGWAEAGDYLALPLVLIASQYASQKILSPEQPKTEGENPAADQTQAILKFLPLMIGWFSLNVPSGLTLYWFTNNIITVATTVVLRKGVEEPQVEDLAVPSTTGGGAPVKRVSAVKERPAAPAGPKPGDRFRALKEKEAAKAGGGAAPGDRFRELQAQENRVVDVAPAAAPAAVESEFPGAPPGVVDVEVVEAPAREPVKAKVSGKSALGKKGKKSR